MTGWKGYGRMFTRTSRWRRAVNHVLRRHGLAGGPIRGTVPGTCAVFAVGSRWIVKFFPPMVAGDWAVERAALEAVAGRPGLPAPRLVASGRLRDRMTWRYLVLAPVAGRPLRAQWPRLAQSDRRRVARELACWLKSLHRIPDGSAVAGRRADWASRRRRLIRSALAVYRASGLWPRMFLAELRQRLERLTATGPRDPLRLVHADVHADHVILARRRGRWRLAGVIDFADAEHAPPLYEWMPVWDDAFRRDLGAGRAFLAAYRIGGRARWRDRAAAWMLIHRFGAAAVVDRLRRERSRPVPADWASLRDRLVPPGLTLR